jgi:acyl carrier protein
MMDSTNARLRKCFGTVFPDLNEEQTLQASAAALAEWDSLATLNLLALIEEEFGVSIDLDELEAPSFKSFLGLIESSPDAQVRYSGPPELRKAASPSIN